MRIALVASLTGLALASLTACSQPAAPGANGTAPSAGGSAPAASAGAPGPLSADQLPHRRPGLWQQTMAMDGQSLGPGMTLCVDEASEAKLNAFAQSQMNRGGAQCAAPQLTRNLDGSIGFSSTCNLAQAGKTVTTGTYHGDFTTSYTADMDTVISGSSMAAMNGDHKMTITATWTGACPAGQRGGDLTSAGQTRNILGDMSTPTSGAGTQ